MEAKLLEHQLLSAVRKDSTAAQSSVSDERESAKSFVFYLRENVKVFHTDWSTAVIHLNQNRGINLMTSPVQNLAENKFI